MTVVIPGDHLFDFIGENVLHVDAMKMMEDLANGLRQGDCSCATMMYLEHHAVVTIGRETQSADIAELPASLDRVPVNRGGKATYHGPGILVGYFVLDLSRRFPARPDLHAYLRALEAGIIAFVSEHYGLSCQRKAGYTGVWAPGLDPTRSELRKIAAIGVGCRRWVTTHGFALNLHPDLSVFQSFVPCGIKDADTSSVAAELSKGGLEYQTRPMKEVARMLHPFLCNALAEEGWQLCPSSISGSFPKAPHR